MMRANDLRHAARILLPALVWASPAGAAMWVDPNWGLIGELRPVVTYDSNLTARSDGVEDWSLAVTPKVLLTRRNSATRFDLDAQVTRTWFQDVTEFNSTDPQVNLLYEYPVNDVGEPRSRVDLHWGRASSTNTDLGRRIRSDSWRGRWDQRLWDSGRTTLDLRLDGRSTDYREADLNTNRAFAVEGRVGYAVAPQVRLGLGYGHEWTRSRSPLDGSTTEGDEDRVTIRANGELWPKVRGSLETGVAFVDYTGAVTRDDTAWIAAGSLTWDATAQTAATLSASRYTDFNPAGETALRSELLVNLTHKLTNGFSLRGGAGVSRLSTFLAGDERQSDALVLIAALAYQMTERFSAEVGERYTRQNADDPVLDYERHVVTGQMVFTF